MSGDGSVICDARAYAELAEEAHGPIPRPVGFAWPWGDALRVLDGAAPDVRVVNLETSVTRDGEFAPGKDVHYRMNPADLPAWPRPPDVFVLANNHVLDFGPRGQEETLDTLAGAGLRTSGAGRDTGGAGDASRPTTRPLVTSPPGRPPSPSATATTSGVPSGNTSVCGLPVTAAHSVHGQTTRLSSFRPRISPG